MVAEMSLANVMEANLTARSSAASQVDSTGLQKVIFIVEYVNQKQPAIQYTYGKYPTFAQAQRALEFVNSFAQYRGIVTETFRN